MNPETACGDCGANPSRPHRDGCDVARCTLCGWQRISCTHKGRNGGWGQTWTGRIPGEAECEELDWWVQDRCAEGLGFVPCDRAAPGASHDLNALASAAQQGALEWDRTDQRFKVSPRFREHIGAITASRRAATTTRRAP